MMELDWEVGELLNKLDSLGIADNTIVVFTSDNGAETFSWPDGGNHPFRGEKGTTYEGGFRVPMVAKWPGVIKAGSIINDIIAGEDWMPTFLAAAGDPDVKEKLLTGMKVGDQTFKNHLDGYNFMPHFKGDAAEPIVTNLRQDPWERYQTESMMYARWWGDKLWTLVPSAAIVGQFLQTLKAYPPSQASGTFSIDRALQMLQAGASGGGH
jgi:arylsulfatase